MSKQFTIITKDGSKWLRPVLNPSDTDQLSRFFQNAGDGFEDLPYIGTRPEGTTGDESEVTAITQARHKDYTGSDWFNVYDNGNWDYHEIRTAYTDAESHDRHIRPFRIHNVRPLVNQLVGEEISFSRFVELLNEIANGNQPTRP